MASPRSVPKGAGSLSALCAYARIQASSEQRPRPDWTRPSNSAQREQRSFYLTSTSQNMFACGPGGSTERPSSEAKSSIVTRSPGAAFSAVTTPPSNGALSNTQAKTNPNFAVSRAGSTQKNGLKIFFSSSSGTPGPDRGSKVRSLVVSLADRSLLRSPPVRTGLRFEGYSRWRVEGVRGLYGMGFHKSPSHDHCLRV
jgi:hypothetical protein